MPADVYHTNDYASQTKQPNTHRDRSQDRSWPSIFHTTLLKSCYDCDEGCDGATSDLYYYYYTTD